MAEYFPIVYVRGYAMTADEVEETFNSPYYGFNLGSTKIKLVNRQLDSNQFQMLIFESPVVRLIKDEEYLDSFNRFVSATNEPIPDSVPRWEEDGRRADWRKTLWVFRFYDAESSLGGQQPRGEIEDYAEMLALFLDGVRRACGTPPGFKVNLVAHSMGGLIVRCYLQNKELFRRQALQGIAPVAVHKFFTYGTPHRGITFRRGLGWVEDLRDLVGYRGSDTFGEKRMPEFLSLEGNGPDGKEKPLHTYEPARGDLPLDRIFCLVGTNYQDYVVWVSKKAVGPGSDGLVAVENAYVRGAGRAVVHRAHSGPLGMVNSEEGYQNLTRFLFGDVQLRVLLEPVEVIGHPPGVRREDELDYLLIEVNFVVRGLAIYIQALRAEDQSAITLDVNRKDGGPTYVQTKAEPLHLFTTFLRLRAKKIAEDQFMRAAIDLRIEPHYKHAGIIRASRFEGEAIVNDRLHLGVMPTGAPPLAQYRWNSEASPDQPVTPQPDGSYLLPLPGVAARYLRTNGLRIVPSPWS